MGCCGVVADEGLEEQPLVPLTSQDGSDGDDLQKVHDDQRFTPKSHLIGFGCIVVATVSVSVALAFSQLLDRAIPHSELTALRFSTQLFLCALTFAAKKKCDVKVDRKSAGWIVFVSGLIVLNQYAVYGTSYYLPLGTSCSVAKCVELTIYLIVGSFVLRHTKIYQFVAVFLCVSGVVLIELPTEFFHSQKEKSFLKHNYSYMSPCGHHEIVKDNVSLFENQTELDPSAMNLTSHVSYKWDIIAGYSLVCLDAISGVAIAYIVTYRLSHINTIIVVFWPAFLGVLLPLVVMALTETPTLPRLTPCVLFLLGHMALSGTHAFFFIYGYTLVPPTVYGLITMLEIPLNFLLQYTVLSAMYPGHANGVEMSGAVMVLLGVALVPLYESVLYFRNMDSQS